MMKESNNTNLKLKSMDEYLKEILNELEKQQIIFKKHDIILKNSDGTYRSVKDIFKDMDEVKL